MLMKWCYRVINFLLRIIKNGILMNFNVKEECARNVQMKGPIKRNAFL
jgi:hypothetical protein